MPTKTAAERAILHSYISANDYERIKQIEDRLAKQFPADWLEREARSIGIYTLCLLTAVAIVLWFTSIGWLSVLLPVLGTPLLLKGLPMSLWRREIGTPRWVHPSVTLTPSEVAVVNDVVASLKPIQRNRVIELCPATSAVQFWEILLLVELFNEGHT